MERDPHFTDGHDPALLACIKATDVGQAGWAGWHAPNKTCADCIHFEADRETRYGAIRKGKCGYLRALLGKPPKVKFSDTARACRYFEDKQ